MLAGGAVAAFIVIVAAYAAAGWLFFRGEHVGSRTWPGTGLDVPRFLAERARQERAKRGQKMSRGDENTVTFR